MKKYWGHHLILDCAGCDMQSVMSKKNIVAFIKELVPAIDMKAYGEPTVAHFAEHDIEAAGYSLVQLIETSSITGHFVDCSGEAYIDIFSCKNFSHKKAVQMVKKYFNPESVRITYLTRQA